ncbi:structural maintenance of chromosomes protein 6 [Ceratina calcarata]|uniref:Structural maintenance of chromosomes protein 6 n=1 Tax=Ceratina calcarata TaxID=156304 RepID=A0AAJ7N5V3_9HYME|nr:structural maintenance of chromosomes protein 6 [Ceratina calcarata]
MERSRRSTKRRKSVESEQHEVKRSRENSDEFEFSDECKCGKIKKILVRNFMCHDALEVNLNPNVNFIVGCNGSGKSAILTALTVGLGAKANVTSRGTSVQNFIKKGNKSALIEITLLNKGLMAYKHDLYGDSITVIRTIGSGASYKIKNWRGEIVSTKRNELNNILRALNIQIDNPISILNQDISRTFLVSSKPEEKYELFMRATLLDVIGTNYETAQSRCQAGYDKLKEYNKIISETRKELEQLKMNIKKAEEINEYREEVPALEMELLWAMVMESERKLEEDTKAFQHCVDNVKKLTDSESSTESRSAKIDEEIQKLKDRIKEVEEVSNNDSTSYYAVKQEYIMKKNAHSIKTREWQSVQSKIKRFESDIAMLKKEIHRLEDESGRNEMKQELTVLTEKLTETEALLTTKETHKMHLESERIRLVEKMRALRTEIDNYNHRIEKIKREIYARKKTSNDAITVFGPNVPRLLRRIEEENNKGHFKEKPRGPLGSYIKMKHHEWTPAVEHFLSPKFLSAFCVDNSRDSKLLSSIAKEIYMNEWIPQIICSKFFHAVHDVSNGCVHSSQYSNLLEAMNTSNPVVANCLIDQREVECILLIPTSNEAAEIMSDASRIPRNCKRAITLQCDIFFPDPHYRSYGGPRNLKGRYLQASATDLIDDLEEEIRTIEKEKNAAVQSYRAAQEKEKRITSELDTVDAEVTKLSSSQNRYKTSVTDLNDKIKMSEAINLTVFKNELIELEQKLTHEMEEEASLNKSVAELRKLIGSLAADIKRHENLTQQSGAKIVSIKEAIKELNDEKEDLHMKSRYAAKKLEEAQHRLQQVTVTVEQQRRSTEKALSDARSRCERINTERSPSEIQRLISEVKSKIREIERQIGNIDELRKELKEKESKYGKDLRLVTKIENTYKTHLKRLEQRRQTYDKMKKVYGENIQEAFATILKLRNKKGTINIDHGRKVLNLEVHSPNNNAKPVTDTRSLSGGERSYSTVAFILALWDCTELPFYFLDEFDVFMDKINRKTVMDILLEHARTHPQCQFTFLTPLDTSAVEVDDYITIHKMIPPVRGTQE